MKNFIAYHIDFSDQNGILFLTEWLQHLNFPSKTHGYFIMRTHQKQHPHLGDVAIENMDISIKSRDDIPAVLLALQYIYKDKTLRDEIFKILEEDCTTESSRNQGRPGMPLWNIFVLGVLRLSLNIDYDRLEDLANNHIKIREMMGRGNIFEIDNDYPLQTIKDNVSLLTLETLNRINVIVVRAGHAFAGHIEDTPLRGRADSYVVETNVDFPSDVKLCFDALRSAIRIILVLCDIFYIGGWREHKAIVRKLKKLGRKIGQLKHSRSVKNQEKKKRKIEEAYGDYITYVKLIIDKIESTLHKCPCSDLVASALIADVKKYRDFAILEKNQMYRRVLLGEKIPNNEKIFSVFEEHTEWISKGKAGVIVELGLKVCVLEDQYGFILNHRVMQDETDEAIAVDIIRETQQAFSDLLVCSFDKGFHSPSNQKELAKLLDLVVLPKKGGLSPLEKVREQSGEFIKARHQHSAIESAINSLEVHGLDRCPDRGLVRFYNYVALGVVGHNLHVLGNKIRNRARDEVAREAQLQRAA